MEKIFCVLGKSSAGKDTLVAIVSKELQIPIATSVTTRSMREKESQGREYNFITEEEFKILKQKGEIAEYTTYNVADNQIWYYGLTREELEKNKHVMVIVNPDGLEQLTKIYEDKIVSILIECDGIERLKRSIERDKTANPKEICRRFLADEESFENIECDYIVYNGEGDRENSILEFKKIIERELEM